MYDFAPAIAACFDHDNSLDRLALEDAIRHLFAHDQPLPISKEALAQLHAQLEHHTGKRKIALVYGGATKIKDYVFEAPKLPEIRGASALLDWVNEHELPALWGASLGHDFAQNRAELTRCGIIYASGGNFLALASVDSAQLLARKIEHAYTDWTLTANSVAVSANFSLLELRYGRNPLGYWIEDFLEDWRDQDRREVISSYYALDSRDTLEVAQGSFFARKNFSELVGLLAGKFYRQREERPLDPRSFYPLQPWDVRCQSSGTRPAVVKTPIIGDELESREMSEASARKRLVGQIFKKSAVRVDWFCNALEWNKPASIPSWRTWSEQPNLKSWEQQWEDYLEQHQESNYARAAAGRHVHSARDVHEIGAASGRYIGMIYADGNRMGRFFSSCSTPEMYAQASQIIADALEQAVFAALATYLEPTGDVHPFEILAIGGDDLLLIVPAKRALDIALHIGHAFESNPKIIQLAGGAEQAQPRTLTDRYYGRAIDPQYDFAAYTPHLSLSTGVVIAQENTPIFFLRDLAEELLKSAKAKAKQHAQMGGTVDFMVLKAVTMVTDNIAEFRKRAFDAYSARRLIARPYTWHELAGLLATARKLREAHIPRSQLYRLREVLDQQRNSENPDQSVQAGIIASSIEYLYTRIRMQNLVAAAVLEHVEQSWRSRYTISVGTSRLGSSAPPWLKLEKNTWETIWHDLVEIYDMLA
ncbi:hydrolase [Oscillochloris trichoides DG-6]|uniref:Hydrolase n=1 Tax=Oscillochloris trichoides DG-6 TaxID=765420 RepID=E1I9T3_9CHLR|nr:hypothetical protein [Oscillochloris trichoides]EFO81935.1 hydrolase [Oscillochloris trichoides DG-6]